MDIRCFFLILVQNRAKQVARTVFLLETSWGRGWNRHTRPWERAENILAAGEVCAHAGGRSFRP